MTETLPLDQALILAIPLSVAMIAIYVWSALALGAVFAKSGEPRWKAWVPFVNVFELLRLGGVPGWWVLIVLVPGIGGLVLWILSIVAAHRINLSFGYGGGMTVLAALLFPVWATVLGFGSARWIGTDGRRRRGVPEQAEDRWTGSSSVSAAAAPPPPPAPPARSPFAPPAPDRAPSPPTPATATDDADLLFAALTQADPESSAPDSPETREAAPPPSVPEPAVPEPAAPVAPTAPEPIAADPAPEPFAPPAPAARPVQTGATGIRQSVDPVDEVTDAVPGAPAPVSAAAERSRYDGAPLFPPVADGEHWATDPEEAAFPEASGEVSAIVGSPVAGSPRRARSAVSASADEDGDFDATLLAHRSRPRWTLVSAAGDEFELRSTVVILGRRPSPDPAHPGAQLLSIDDVTVSKTHARFELRGDSWYVVDLDSTNGVVVVSGTGTEIELAPGGEAPATDRVLLGDLELRLVRAPR